MTADDPIASYRLQLGPGLDLHAVRALLGTLADLGITHLYLSPVADAVPGSPHGYDVVDHTRVRAELGGSAALDQLFHDAAELGLAVVIDHVPNHVSVARPELQRHWWTMLREGAASPSARWFDVDWELTDGQVVLPVLDRSFAEVLATGDLRVDRGGGEPQLVLLPSGQVLPLAPGTEHLGLAEALDHQRYRLVPWTSEVRNVRRFFTVDDLVAVRVEHPEVADEVDTLPERWTGHRGFGGLRVDHVDGLADPGTYLAGLRARIGPDRWLLVEKITAAGERLPASWPVDGTTGYEFMRLVDHLLLDPESATPFDRIWVDIAAEGSNERFSEAGLAGYDAVDERARREVLQQGLRPDLERVVRAVVAALDAEYDGSVGAARPDSPATRSARLGRVEHIVTELTVRLPRYRTYLPDDPDGAAVLDAALDAVLEAALTGAPEDVAGHAETCRQVAGLLRDPRTAAGVDARTRWQQLTGPAMAKGAEDRAFFRYLRLASLSEVGGEPGSFGVSVQEFHDHNRWVQQHRPRTMLAGSTHDTKRSEDVRARSAALTWRAADWTRQVRRWLPAVVEQGLDPMTAYLAIQTVVTCPGLDAERLGAFLVKSAREAGVITSWTDPDAAVEATMRRAADAVVGGGPLAGEVAAWASTLDRDGLEMSLVALVLRLTSPGVPDVYQGCEQLSYRLVDPDNRRSPDWETFADVVGAAAGLDLPGALGTRPELAKTVALRRLLAARHRHGHAVGAAGSYQALRVEGRWSERSVAYARGDSLVTAVRCVPSGAERSAPERGRADTLISLPPGRWRSVLCDGLPDALAEVALDDIAGGLPAVVLERID